MIPCGLKHVGILNVIYIPKKEHCAFCWFILVNWLTVRTSKF